MDNDSNEVVEETKALIKSPTIFAKIKDTLYSAIGRNVNQVGDSLNTIRDILRPGLTEIAHSMNKPYVEPTISFEFAERWGDGEDILEEVTAKYQDMLASVPNRNFWRI